MEELKQKAENFIIDRYKLNECYREDNEETREYMRMDVHSQYEEEYQLYLAGAEENGIVWHDLRKDPNDLPKDNGMVLVRFEKPIMKFSYFCHPEKKFSVWNKEYGCNVQVHNVIAWCEIPQFKE